MSKIPTIPKYKKNSSTPEPILIEGIDQDFFHLLKLNLFSIKIKSNIDDKIFIDKIIYWIRIFLVGLSISAGLSIFFWQIYKWLTTGFWIEVPISKAFVYFGGFKDWTSIPKIAQFLLAWPLSIVLPLFTWIITAIIKTIIQEHPSTRQGPDYNLP